jgi:hypothetical protein
MTDYLSASAGLRPLMTRDQYKEIFPTDRWDEHRGGGTFGVSVDYGPDAQNAPDGIGRENIVESVSFEAPFPAAIYGFTPGMSRAEAEEGISRAGLEALAPTGPDYRYYTGKSADGFELMLRFHKGRLDKLTLSQPNPAEIGESRRQSREKRYAEEMRQRELASAWKQIKGDDDTMLLTWARHCRPWSDSEPSEFMRYAEWLLRADPDQRHAAALTWNWDYGLAPLLWMIRRDDCDLATALHIFFSGGPESFLKYGGDRALVAENSVNLMTYDMIIEIKGRIERGFYARSAIRYDLSKAFEVLDRYKPTAEQRDALIPAGLATRKEGRRIAYENGLGGVDLPAFRIH